MWTPRRVLLLLIGVAVFGTAFGVYARFLGGIDGLPQLPDELLTRREPDESLPPASMTPTQHKLQLAFGKNCVEIGYRYQLELPGKGIVFAADGQGIEEGRLRFSPCSIATFKEKTPGEHPEINTAHGDIVYLEFDQPIHAVSEINKRRLVACELVSDPGLMTHDPRRGRVHILNNRGTLTPDDDLTLRTPGPVSYREAAQPNLPLDKARPQLWTGAAVELVDRRSQPQPTTITSQGMQVYLALESPNAAKPAKGDKVKADKAKARGTSITGVRRVVLPANVEMNLWMDPGNGFLSAGAAKAQPAPKPGDKPAERTNVRISTLGPFTYDVGDEADRARFDRLPPAATQLPNFVKVVRPQARGPGAVVYDQLECDVLELQFSHKPKSQPGKPAPAKKDDGDVRGTVDWIHAWGDLIVLTSDEEKLDARGNDLFHDAKTKTTVLKGSPEMVAVKDGSEIHAPELHLFGAGAKDGQQAKAQGAGYVKLYERTGTARAIEARWRESLSYRKEDGKDLLTLLGDATFEDRERAQLLKADSLKLWLAPESKPNDPAATAKPGDKDKAGRPRPQKLDALGRVTARSPQLHVDDTDSLVLLFTDAPPRPAAALPTQPASPAAPAPKPAATAQQPARPNDPSKKPIELKAKRVQAFVLVRPGETTNELDTVHCEEEVRIHQDPPTPNDKPIDMRGQKVTLKHRAEGNVLQVNGTLAAPGEVHFPDLSLLGPSITIDQIENSAHVNGVGSMKMASTTGMNGEKLKKPTDLIVYWKQEMRFNGELAQFHGNVQAEQDAMNILCNNMQVYLSKPVQLNRRPGEARGKDAAGIVRVVCDDGEQQPPQPVRITEQTIERGRLIKFQQIESKAIAMYKEEGQLEAGVGGTVRLLQLGPKDDKNQPFGGTQPAKKPNPAKPAEEEHKLTWVRYGDRMVVNNPKRTAKFYGTVHVLHFPWEDPGHNLVMDKLIDKLPPGGMYLRSDQIEVYSTRDANGKTYQSMEAKGNAFVQAQEFNGFAHVIKYDESKQQVVFEGSEGRLAELYRFLVKGQKPDTIKAKKITYNRMTGAFSTDGTQVTNIGG